MKMPFDRRELGALARMMLVASLSASLTAQTVPCIRPPVRSWDDPHEFARTFVDSLRRVRSALSGLPARPHEFIPPTGVMATVYVALQPRPAPGLARALPEIFPSAMEQGAIAVAESGKINLNFVSEDQLRRLCVAIGLSGPDADIIADSIYDWRDVDSNPRPNGAEDSYYLALNPPYKAKNGRVDAVEELLLVRGVTRDRFFGLPKRGPDGSLVRQAGLSSYFTVYSTTNRININHAPAEVLASIPGMDPDVARRIYDRRIIQPFENPEDVMGLFSGVAGVTAYRYLSTTPALGHFGLRGKPETVKGEPAVSGLRTLTEALLCAASTLEGFNRSGSRYTAIAAREASEAYSTLADVSRRIHEEGASAEAERDTLPGSVPERVTSRTFAIEQSWRLLAAASRHAALALVDPNANPAGNRLAITSAQASVLIQTLEGAFEELSGGIRSDKTYLDNIAALFVEFLKDSRWRFRRSK